MRSLACRWGCQAAGNVLRFEHFCHAGGPLLARTPPASVHRSQVSALPLARTPVPIMPAPAPTASPMPSQAVCPHLAC